MLKHPNVVQGGGGISCGDNFVGKFRFQFGAKFSPRNFFAQFGGFPALCDLSVAAVARYCCAVIGSTMEYHEEVHLSLQMSSFLNL